MIRNLLVLLVFLSVGLGANVAQSDIFVRKSPKQETTQQDAKTESKKKTNIFLRPFKKKDQPSAKNRYGSRLNTEGIRRQAVQDLRMLAYWQQAGRKPEGLKELNAYAFAMRAQNLADMFTKRSKALPGLVQKHEKRFAVFEQQLAKQAPDRAAVDAADKEIMAALGIKDQSAKAVRAVYQSYGAGAVNAVKSDTQEEKPGVRQSVRSVAPIYRRQNNEDNSSSGSTSRVYKNYR